MTTENVVAFPKMQGVTQSPSAEPIPEFITPTDFATLSQDQQDQMIEALRQRRLSAQRLYQETVAKAAQAEASRAKERMAKKSEQIIKKLDMCNKHIDMLEKYINEYRGLCIQAAVQL